MNVDTLARLSKGSDLAVLVAIVAAHVGGMTTVRPIDIQRTCGESDKTTKRRLTSLQEAGLVEQVTTHKWRVTPAGCSLLGVNPEILRLSKTESRNISAQSVDNSPESRNISGIMPAENGGVFPGMFINSVSIHRLPGEIPAIFENDGNSVISNAVVVSSSKSQLLTHKTTATAKPDAGQVERLLGVLVERAPRTSRTKAAPILEQLLACNSADQIELDILAHCARIEATDNWATARSGGAVVLALIRDGAHACPADREYLARGSPDDGAKYDGFLDDAPATHPDVQRFDELMAGLTGERSEHHQ